MLLHLGLLQVLKALPGDDGEKRRNSGKSNTIYEVRHDMAHTDETQIFRKNLKIKYYSFPC